MNAHTLNGMAVKNHSITLALVVHAFQIVPPVHRTRSASGATRKGHVEYVIIGNVSNPGEGILSVTK